jgi:hypothetical protein
MCNCIMLFELSLSKSGRVKLDIGSSQVGSAVRFGSVHSTNEKGTSQMRDVCA